MSIEFQEPHRRRFVQLESHAPGDLPKRMVEMWKVIHGHIAYKRRAYFIVPRPPMQPAKEEIELCNHWNADNNPIEIHFDFP